MFRRPPRSTRTDTLCPTRRSSYLEGEGLRRLKGKLILGENVHQGRIERGKAKHLIDEADRLPEARRDLVHVQAGIAKRGKSPDAVGGVQDRKSTRLNSSN